MKTVFVNTGFTQYPNNVILMPNQWLTKSQLAQALQISTRTIERWMTNGLPHCYFGGRPRYQLSQIEAYWNDKQGVTA